MARRQAPPKPEELIAKLEEKLDNFKTEITSTIGEKSSEIEKINEQESAIKEQLDANSSAQTAAIDDAKLKIENMIDTKMEDMRNDFLRNFQGMSDKIARAGSSTAGTEDQIQELVERVESIQEKMYDFEVNKRNNLLFYGIKGGQRETPGDLLNKVLFNKHCYGLSDSGTRPLLYAFCCLEILATFSPEHYHIYVSVVESPVYMLRKYFSH